MTIFHWTSFWGFKQGNRLAGSDLPAGGPGKRSLVEIEPGRSARVERFLPQISADHRAHLFAYGLQPGREVRVLQHSPVTVVQIEFTELALESALAKDIQVEAL